jgi:hypothetical protein
MLVAAVSQSPLQVEASSRMRVPVLNQCFRSITRYGVGKQSLFNIDVYTHRFDYIAALEKAVADNAELQEQLNRATEGGAAGGANKEDSPMIPRPAGTAGSKWSIQVEMGLGGTGRKYDSYKAIQVGALRHNSIVHSPTMYMQSPHTHVRAHTHFSLYIAKHSRLGT